MTATLEAPADLTPDPSEPATAEPPPRPIPESLRPWHDPNPWQGRVLTLIVVLVAGLIRLWDVGFPQGRQFDEAYYPTEAQELLRFGYEDNRGYMFIVHPPLGKWLIALSTELWEPTSGVTNTVDWRLSTAIAGTLSVLLLVRIARRMFRSNIFGAIAGLLLALDGLSVVLSRIALLDIFLQLFVVAGFGAMLVDRDQMRGRLAGLLEHGVDLSGGIPTLGPRPWRLLAGVMFGLACGVKWTGLSFFIAFVVLSLWWDRGALKAAGVRRSWREAARRSWIGALGSYVLAPLGVYLLVWIGWFAGENSWNRHWADSHRSAATLHLLGLKIPFNWGWVPGGIRSLGDYTYNAYQFHETLYSPHIYGSKPWSWLILGRPVAVYSPGGQTGCGASQCSREIVMIGTPLMWWAFLPMLIWLAWHYATTRDWRAGVVWVAMIAGWFFWFRDLRRTMFLFYMAPLVPFLIIGLTLALGTMLGPAVSLASSAAELLRRRIGAAVVCMYLGIVIADFVWMWPLFTGSLLTYDQWHARMWFNSWI